MDWYNEESVKKTVEIMDEQIQQEKIKYCDTTFHGFDCIPQVYSTLYEPSEKPRGNVVVKL